jgi:hypothetical protein
MGYRNASALVIVTAVLTLTAAAHSANPSKPRSPPIHPSAAVVRAFAETALQHLKGPAQRPFLKLLNSLPPKGKEPGITVSTKATKNVSCSGGVCTPTAAKAVLNVSELTRLLVAGNVTIATSAVAPDIFINASFSWMSANALTLQAIGDITVNNAVSDAGPGPLDLEYDITGGGGVLSFGNKGSISFMGVANPLTINGQNYLLAADIRTMARLIQDNPSGNFALARSYDASHDGKYTQSPINVTFNGNLNGLGNMLLGLKVESSSQGNGGGLIVATGSTATIDYLRLQHARIVFNPFSAACVGGITGTNNGTITGVSFSGSVTAFSLGDYVEAGGIACENYGTIATSAASGAVTASSTVEFAWAGGIAAYNSGSIDLSNASGPVSAQGSGRDEGDCSVGAGGLVGHDGGGSTGTSFATGDVTASDIAINNACAGGLMGSIFSGNIDGSYATGSATTHAGSDASWMAGGLVGLATDGAIKNSSAGGASFAYNAGGLVGGNEDSIDNSYANGAVSGPNGANVGGLMGDWQSDQGSTVTNSISYGAVTNGGGGLIGGFVGADATSGNFSNDQWCTTSSGITDPSQGAGNVPNDPGITPFTC